MADEESPPRGKGILHPEGMQAVRDFTSGVVHEVNNILGVIIGNAHLADKNVSSPDALEKYMGEVRGAAEEGRDLMRRLAVLAGEESARSRALSLNDLVLNAVAELDTPAELDLSVEDATVQLDVWMAREALAGAALFMAQTKAVTSVRVATRVVGSAVALTIEDDGASPSDKELGALFTPFTKLDRRPKVGLELTRLADLASRAGGYVTASVREPRGLRIVLTLPVTEGTPSGDSPGVSLPKKSV
jgi:signal transduction histidine kinase